MPISTVVDSLVRQINPIPEVKSEQSIKTIHETSINTLNDNADIKKVHTLNDSQVLSYASNSGYNNAKDLTKLFNNKMKAYFNNMLSLINNEQYSDVKKSAQELIKGIEPENNKIVAEFYRVMMFIANDLSESQMKASKTQLITLVNTMASIFNS